ncbi:sugar efflux transporter B [Gloeothece citriformis PCC 7424]|uniref:Sugar efflux transporter B n=1 Tax=Gloeothece citriformis (strain PCC 7424) TaxID=65393 RepID=B7KLF1_GLOC7|nr:immunity 26/phosphotriesterase HocA family protein [Gloeothece citriformis]ACK72523.1 sugar efflux transporter B [Gloeothece citriformis PCC 7424]
MVSFKHGDIFTFQLPNQKYIFGRILLDVKKQCIKPKLIDPNSPLSFYEGTILVEIYQALSENPTFTPSEILIPGFFLDPEPIKAGEWKIIDYQEVDPLQVEFPETLALVNGRQSFQRGEIILILPQKLDEDETYKIYPTITSPYALPKICLYQLGLTELLNPAQLKTMNLKRYDLRFSEHRSEIYQMLNENENQSYYQMSKRLGHDITRFY